MTKSCDAYYCYITVAVSEVVFLLLHMLLLIESMPTEHHWYALLEIHQNICKSLQPYKIPIKLK